MPKQPDAQQIATLIQHLHQQMHACLWKKTPVDVGGLTIQQARTLQFIQRNPEIPMGDIAKELAITKASVNALVNRLCRDGWLLRKHDKQDRRIHRVVLTARAHKRLKTILLHKRQVAESMINTLSPADRQHLHRILLKLS